MPATCQLLDQILQGKELYTHWDGWGHGYDVRFGILMPELTLTNLRCGSVVVFRSKTSYDMPQITIQQAKARLSLNQVREFVRVYTERKHNHVLGFK